MFQVYYRDIMKNWITGLFISCLFFLASCVGTVVETSSNITDIGSDYTPVIHFDGIHSVVGISDTKIEIFFYPASGGSGKYIYDIYRGNNPTPTSIPSDILTPDYRGLLRHTVIGLEQLNTYTFNIQVRDQLTNGKSTNNQVKSATTFNNRVADFLGISSASNMPGQDGKDSILVRFTPAPHSGSLSDEEWDPKSYELVIVDADRLTPADMDTDFTTSQGRWVFKWDYDKDNSINQYVAKGLLPKKKYYVRVRVIHRASVDDIYRPNLKGEMNTKYVEITTLSDELADIQFDSSSFFVSILSGGLGLNTIRATWNKVEGVFDHFRLYYSKKGGGVTGGSLPELCLTETQSLPSETIYCKKSHYTATSTQITGLLPYTEYDFVLVVCQTTECLPHQRIVSSPKSVTTDPATIFNGISLIETSTHIEGSEMIIAHYEDPNVIGGYFDGLILKMRRTLDGSDAEIEITENSTPVYHRPFDPMNTTEIEIQGIDYLTDQPYCFRLYPYKWNDTMTERREIANENWKCFIPKIEPPSASSFPGLEAGSTQREYVTLRWPEPSQGFYTNYVVFMRPGNVFNWGDAMAAFAGVDNGYDFWMIDGSDLTTTISGLPSGQYIFGILTYHLYISDTEIVEKWSDTNTKFLKCTVDNSSTVNVDCNF